MKTRIYKIVRGAAGQLRQELAAGSRLVFLFVDPSGALMPCWPRTDVPQLSTTAQELLKLCLKRERSLLIQSNSDPILSTLGQAEFEAVLCVPLLDSDRNAVGLIYADNPRAGAFSNEDRLKIERLARGMITSLPRVGTAEPQGPTEQPEPPSAWASKAGIALAVLAVGFVTLWFLAPATRPVQPEVVSQPPPKIWASDPAAVIKSFNRLLTLREHGQAWKLLHPELQATLSAQDFTQQASEWLSDEAHRWEFPRRQLRVSSSTTEEAVCLLDPAEELAELETWEWTLRIHEGQWRIAKMRGGPLAPEASSSER